ncbi:MAG: Kae1-associated kinase Bud32 [Infirmifilum sp.]
MEKVTRVLEGYGLSQLEEVAVGAEAILIRGILSGEDVIAKCRVPKPYRDPALDLKLRRSRTSLEAHLMAKAGVLGLRVPSIVFFSAESGVIIMSFVPGLKIKELIDRGDKELVCPLMEETGYMVATLHLNGIIHGDLTTSNFLVSGGHIWLIDFGLGFFSQRDEDRGTEIHLLLRVLESSHPRLADSLFQCFVEGYRKKAGDAMTNKVLEKMREIRLRGRYVASRRTR